jgi:signal peptidase II
LIHNTGAAFGLLANLPPEIREPFFLVLPSLTLTAILYAYYKLPDEDVMSIYGLILIVGGALGNLIDRVRLGYVVDFLDFHWYGKYHFPAFNVADSAICIGVGILIVNLIITPEPEVDNKPTGSSIVKG